MISDELSAVRTKVAGTLARRPECFVTHPSELAILQKMTREELEEFARANGWRMVERLGGSQYQFYNDTYEQLRNEAVAER